MWLRPKPHAKHTKNSVSKKENPRDAKVCGISHGTQGNVQSWDGVQKKEEPLAGHTAYLKGFRLV